MGLPLDTITVCGWQLPVALSPGFQTVVEKQVSASQEKGENVSGQQGLCRGCSWKYINTLKIQVCEFSWPLFFSTVYTVTDCIIGWEHRSLVCMMLEWVCTPGKLYDGNSFHFIVQLNKKNLWMRSLMSFCACMSVCVCVCTLWLRLSQQCLMTHSMSSSVSLIMHFQTLEISDSSVITAHYITPRLRRDLFKSSRYCSHPLWTI